MQLKGFLIVVSIPQNCNAYCGPTVGTPLQFTVSDRFERTTGGQSLKADSIMSASLSIFFACRAEYNQLRYIKR